MYSPFMTGCPSDAWLAVPAISKWVAVGLSSPNIPGSEAVECALSLPELRAFAEAAISLGIDVTAPAGEWTSTCIIRQTDGPVRSFKDRVAHHCRLKRHDGEWVLLSCDVGTIQAAIPQTGWVYSGADSAWFDSKTGLPLATTESLVANSEALRVTGFSYFWEPEPTDGISIVIRECERLCGQVMDICAAMEPSHAHPDIRLREWLPLDLNYPLPARIFSRPCVTFKR